MRYRFGVLVAILACIFMSGCDPDTTHHRLSLRSDNIAPHCGASGYEVLQLEQLGKPS